MSDFIRPDDERPTGYYWIAGMDDPEVARWNADSQRWALIGLDGEGDERPHVLFGPLVPPP